MEQKSSEDILLELVIEYFIKYGSPVGSKFLFNLENIDIAPSTIRKYLNVLEKKGLVYQPYASSGRLPTIEGMDKYVLSLLTDDQKYEKYYNKNLKNVNQKFNLRGFIEALGEWCDGVVFGHYEDNSNMHYLGVSKILKKVNNDIEQIIPLMDFIEKNEVISYIRKKKIEKEKINYSFMNYNGANIGIMYIKIYFEGKETILGILSSLRADYKKNIKILKKVLTKGNI